MAARSLPVFPAPFNTYKATGLLGEGGSARVYRATSEEGLELAVKVLSQDKFSRDKLKRFKNEILFASTHKHPGLVPVLDQGLVTLDKLTVPFYVMPLYSSTLRKALESGLPPQRRLPLYSSLLDAMEAAHLLQVFHRDLKPENIFLDDAGTQLLVGDFGIARFTEEELYTAAETRDGARLANFLYAAPEQRVRGRAVDQRADIYALGLILNEIFTGLVPHGTNFARISSRVPEGAYLDPIVDEMLQQDPKARPDTIDSIKRRLMSEGLRFVGLQKLASIEGKVVKADEITEPVPIRIVKADIQGGELVVTLSEAPSPSWIQFYRETTNVSHILGYNPQEFPIGGHQVRVRVRPGVDQQVLTSLSAAISMANGGYPAHLRKKAADAAAAERSRLEQAAREERERLERASKLKW